MHVTMPVVPGKGIVRDTCLGLSRRTGPDGGQKMVKGRKIGRSLYNTRESHRNQGDQEFPQEERGVFGVRGGA